MWADAIEQFSAAQRGAGQSVNTIASRKQHLQQVGRTIGIASPWEVETDELLSWAGSIEWAPETRRSRYNTYRAFWGWAKATKRCKRDAGKRLPKVKPGQADPSPVPERVYQKAMMRASERERTWLQLAHDHGLRRGEIATVHSDDIFEDLIGHTLVVQGKGSKTRRVPLTPQMAAMLLALPSGWAFPGDHDGHISPRWIGKRATDLLDGDWTIHKLRHRAVTSWYLTHGEFVAQELAGHASPATTRIYVKLPDERLRAAILAGAA